MEDSGRLAALLDNLSEAEGRIHALTRAVRVLMANSPDANGVRLAMDRALDGLIAQAAIAGVSEPAMKGIKKVQRRLVTAPPDQEGQTLDA